MKYGAAILNDRWQPVDLLPGAHVVVLTQSGDLVLAARIAGFSVRDTMLVVGSRITRLAFLFRKPFEAATATEQILRTGTGGLNIEPCRVRFHFVAERSSSGRWPSNVVLMHAPTCARIGNRRIAGHKGYPNGPGGSSTQFSQKGTATTRTSPWAGHADVDGKETVPMWDCQGDCPVRLLDEQSGHRPSTLTGRADPSRTYENPGNNGGTSLFGGGNSKVYADTGGASRFFPQFTNEVELQTWMTRLIAPPDTPVFFG